MRDTWPDATAWFSGVVLLALVGQGMLREDAYPSSRTSAMHAWREGGRLRPASSSRTPRRWGAEPQEVDARWTRPVHGRPRRHLAAGEPGFSGRRDAAVTGGASSAGSSATTPVAFFFDRDLGRATISHTVVDRGLSTRPHCGQRRGVVLEYSMAAPHWASMSIGRRRGPAAAVLPRAPAELHGTSLACDLRSTPGIPRSATSQTPARKDLASFAGDRAPSRTAR